ncbi:6 TM domain-containing transmembrane protein [Acrasis kona]|uniref:6 TM domain-containing transmembrane protein n=1 Tax=Acrasis kona TaxID=1008807 RepID=A0AAW2ZI04_9EUKA
MTSDSAPDTCAAATYSNPEDDVKINITAESPLVLEHRYLNTIVEKLSRGSPSSTLGNPGPLGLAGFAMTTFLLSCWNTGLLSAGTAKIVLPVALWYGGIAQLLAGMWELAASNTFGALAFTSYGAFWLSYATIEQFWVPAQGVTEQDIGIAVGMYLLAWTIFTLYMMVGTFRMSVSLMLVFIFLEIAFILLTAGSFSGNSKVTAAGGWFGILTAFFAWYASAAVVINTTYGVQLLPIGVVGPIKRDPNLMVRAKSLKDSFFRRSNERSTV